MSDHHFGDQRDDQPGDRPVDAIGARTGTRARGLINDGDPRVAAVERQLGPELVEPLPPERLRYLAALAVAVCDEHADRGDRGADDRPARREEHGGRGERTRSAHAERSRATRALAGVLAGVFLLLLLVLAASVVAAVAAAVIALWRAVL